MERKKVLKEDYKNKRVVGGIFGIRCKGSDQVWLKSTMDLAGQKNRFEFSVKTNSCPEPAMLKDWKSFGKESFSFEVLEELEKNESQSDREFKDDLATLLEIWREKI
ncbi:GIY-YIG nuclease family protein [Eubacteriaceae bacterium ES3]|nr:GIY-YIG nuclease family protein [Eubacteriaceae bacterium ES3]